MKAIKQKKSAGKFFLKADKVWFEIFLLKQKKSAKNKIIPIDKIMIIADLSWYKSKNNTCNINGIAIKKNHKTDGINSKIFELLLHNMFILF